jgi:hypothetical protein
LFIIEIEKIFTRPEQFIKQGFRDFCAVVNPKSENSRDRLLWNFSPTRLTNRDILMLVGLNKRSREFESLASL